MRWYDSGKNAYFSNFKIHDVTVGKTKTVFRKVKFAIKIALVEEGRTLTGAKTTPEIEKVISHCKEFPETFNEFLVNIVSTPKILPGSE